jgi:hypothetical protein
MPIFVVDDAGGGFYCKLCCKSFGLDPREHVGGKNHRDLLLANGPPAASSDMLTMEEAEVAAEPLLASRDARKQLREQQRAQHSASLAAAATAEGSSPVAVSPIECVPCGKRFAKQTLYDAHLSGKKHRAALAKMERTKEALAALP